MPFKTRAKKLFLSTVDERFVQNRQLSVLNFITDGSDIYQNSYGKVYTLSEIGDFEIFLTEPNKAALFFYPIDGRINDYSYTYTSYDIEQTETDSGELILGDIVSIASTNVEVSANNTKVIFSIDSNYTSSKLIIQLKDQFNEYYEYNEINLVGINGQEAFNRYGIITIGESDFPLGIGEYTVSNNGSSTELIFSSPFNDRSVNLNIVSVSFANTSFDQVGEKQLRHSRLESNKVSIAATTNPVPVGISTYSLEYTSGYFIVQVTDKTNNIVEISEVVVVSNENNAFAAKYGDVSLSQYSLGTFDVGITTFTELTFTPLENIDVDVVVYKNSYTLAEFSTSPVIENLGNFEIKSGISRYQYGNEDNYKIDFDLKYKGINIFERQFDPQNSTIVDIEDDTIRIPNHFFVTGEKINYRSEEFLYSSDSAIGIAQTNIVGIGITTKLGGDLFVYKVDDTKIKLCTSPQQALSSNPTFIDFTSLGIGRTHYLISTDQNKKCLITIDNVVQSPIVATSVTCSLTSDINLLSTTLEVSDPDLFSAGDLIEIGDEIMKIDSVGVGSTNFVGVKRPWLGTGSSLHFNGNVIKKLKGNYNIIDNKIYFANAPYGKKPKPQQYQFSQSSIPEYEINSTFHGRVFLRSGVSLSSTDTYSTNYIFDDISPSFNATSKQYELTSNGTSVSDISDQNSLLLINNVLQIPEEDFKTTEVTNKTYVNFTGTATSVSYDPNNASVPKGGVILSVGSTNGFGFQPLVSAGGTAIVSLAGTIQSISIGNSGSGYRAGIQTNVRVGVKTYSSGLPNIEYIGTATVSNGNIVSININQSGSQYDQSNPPEVIIDSPLPYYNIPLIYSSLSQSGFGTEAKVNIVVGQGSSVIDFKFNNFGYAYQKGDILTFEVGGNVGIPTDTSKPYQEFSLIVDEVYSDSFSSWNVGELELFDDISSYFDGNKKTFRLILDGNRYSILKRKGSNIDLKSTLLVILNDVVQIPDESYIFEGGSTITFIEPPRKGDSCNIIFYKGTPDIDVKINNILETLKVGDQLKINSDDRKYTQKNRIVREIIVPDVVETIAYYGDGISDDEDFVRPVNVIKQRNDIIIDDISITKDRLEYESSIHPVAKIISNVGVGDTNIWVDSIIPIFNYKRENADLEYTNEVEIISNRNSYRAIADSVVSISGTISSIILLDGGYGYNSNPVVSISNPYYSNGERATAQAFVNSEIVTNIQLTNSGFGYTNTNPPIVLIESPHINRENIKDIIYYGDFGIISGITTISVPNASNGLVFDLLIPNDSILKDSNYVDPPIAVSDIETDYYFTVYDSTVGSGLTSLDKNGQIIGIGTKGIDNVYQVISVSIGTTDAFGIGPATVAKVIVSVSDYNNISGLGYSNFYGRYSWGLINTENPITKSFEINTNINDIPYVKRANQLKYTDYL